MPIELHKYQVEGADFLANRWRCGLFDKPRCGKSAQTIRALDLTGARRVLVICPAIVRENWRKEFRKFSLRPDLRICKGVTIHDFVAWQRDKFDVLCTSFEKAVAWSQDIINNCEMLDAIVIDEGHYLKNHEAGRTRALLGRHCDGVDGLLQWSKQAFWLTGTPVPNDPMDIYTFLRFVDVMPYGVEQFKKRYFHVRPRTYGTSQTAKLDMVDELRQLIANNSMCRSLADTGVDLPPIYLTNYSVDGEAENVRQMLRQHPGLDAAILRALEEEKGLSGLDAQHMATLRRLIGEAKAVPYAATLLHELQSGLDKVVVFAHHRSVLQTVRDFLVRHGITCGVINGDTPEKERNAIQDQFASDGRFKAVLLNIRAGGTGINLTAAAAIDLLESDWAPMSNFQALMRVYGQTQRRTVNGRLIVLGNSFDEQIQATIERKTQRVLALDTSPSNEVQRVGLDLSKVLA